MLKLQDVAAGYGQAGVLHGLSFDVDDGEVVVLLGRNGMGKTSTMRAVMGWDDPQVTGGSITFDGAELRGSPSHKVASAGLGYVPQGRLIFPSLNVEEHLLVAARPSRGGGAWSLDRVFELFPKLGQRRTQRASTLSGGEQQMLVIGRALMTNPRLLLLDEPSEGLAPLIVRQVGETLATLRGEGMSILVAEQDVRFAIGLADRVVILERGRVVAEGTPEEIDGDDELKRRHLGVESASASRSGATVPAEPSPNGQAADLRVVAGHDRRPRRRGTTRVAPSEVTRVTTLLGGHPWDRRLFSNGWCETTAEPNSIVEPATGATLGEVAVAGLAETSRAVASAADTQPAWADTSIDERCEVLLGAAAHLRQSSDEVTGWLVREAGHTQAEATSALDRATSALRSVAGLAAQPAGELLQPRGSGGRVTRARAPVGVVGVITAATDPLVLGARAVGTALALGNAVVLKPDVRTAVSGGIALARLLEEAGLPHGLLHVLPGSAATAQAIVTDPRVGAVTFAGSQRAGQHLAAVAGQNLTPISLHLGGSNAFIVLDDADVEIAAANGAAAAFAHQGQRCTAAGRHLVHSSLVRDYVDLLAKHAASLRLGDPNSDEDVDVGPLIDASRAQHVSRIVDASVARGAGHRVGGVRSGALFPPTVLVDVTPTMPAFITEIGGPVVPVTVFETDEQAITLAGQSGPGSSAVIHGLSVSRAHAVARDLAADRVAINGSPVDDTEPDEVFTRRQRTAEPA